MDDVESEDIPSNRQRATKVQLISEVESTLKLTPSSTPGTATASNTARLSNVSVTSSISSSLAIHHNTPSLLPPTTSTTDMAPPTSINVESKEHHSKSNDNNTSNNNLDVKDANSSGLMFLSLDEILTDHPHTTEEDIKVKLVPIEFDVPLPSSIARPDIICSYPDEMEAHRIRYREKTWSHVGSIPERFALHETALYRFAYVEYFAVGSTTSSTVLVYGNILDPSSPSAPARSSLVQSILLPDKVRF